LWLMLISLCAAGGRRPQVVVEVLLVRWNGWRIYLRILFLL
jgi:hypothetical protein